MDQAGIIERLLPCWGAVRSAPQRNAVHRYTVDRHLVQTAVEASALAREVNRPDLLLVGALLHDIGKGRGGDHSVVGAAIADSANHNKKKYYYNGYAPPYGPGTYDPYFNQAFSPTAGVVCYPAQRLCYNNNGSVANHWTRNVYGY